MSKDDMDFNDIIEALHLLKNMKPKPDDPDCKTPCSTCLGSDNGCCDMPERNPKEECNGWENSVEIKYKDGSKQTIKKRKK